MQLSKAYRQYGDLGDSATSFFQKKTFFVTTVRTLSIVKVYQSLQAIVATDGRDAKQHILLQLMRSCQTKTELRFLVRLLIGNMRVGANLKTVLAALAMAIGTDQDKKLDIKGAVELIQKTHDVCPNLEKIIGSLLAGGLEQMKHDCGIQVLTPIAPMLAHPVHSLEQVEKVMHEKKNSVVMEWKYDGVRCQAHYDGTTIKLFSRHMLETTAQYPDAAKSFLDAIKEDRNVQSFIIDSEIVGVEEEGDQNRLLPFQDLSRRKRKNDDGQGVRVKVFAFDLVYLNGISFVDRPLWERQKIFRDYFKETKDYAYVSSQVLPSYEETKIKEFLEEAVRSGAEGLMVKMLGKYEAENVNENTQLPQVDSSTETSPYEAGTRSHNWLKVKRDYVAGYADTIDVVPIGAW
jgi:DNA ligase-1